MKGRSPFMRHVSRTQRITLDLFFDRINFDPKIQIRYVDTKIELTDILTKDSFFFFRRWVKQLASFEDHPDCVHVSSQSCQSFYFRFVQKFEIHVEERTGAKFYWWICSDETNVNELHTLGSRKWLQYSPEQTWKSWESNENVDWCCPESPTRNSDWIGHDWECQTLSSENTGKYSEHWNLETR